MSHPGCMSRDCGNVASWRPVLRFHAPAPYTGSFTAELSLSLCAKCKGELKVTDLLSDDMMRAVTGMIDAAQLLPPDFARTTLEFLPVAESTFDEELASIRKKEEDARARGGGPVGFDVFICDDPIILAEFRRTWRRPLTEVIPPAAIAVADLESKWGRVNRPPVYCCAACAGTFPPPAFGDKQSGVLVMRPGADGLLDLLFLHVGCLEARRVAWPQ